jgi:hypothetical protein
VEGEIRVEWTGVGWRWVRVGLLEYVVEVGRVRSK